MINRLYIEPFNSPVEIGLRTVILLTTAYPITFSIEQLVALDYMLVHSDDIPSGPDGLHPKTPLRSGEILIRRKNLYLGIELFMWRGLICQEYSTDGIKYAATDMSKCFIDSLSSEYINGLKSIAEWVIDSFGLMNEKELRVFVQKNIDKWDADFAMESVLWQEDSQ